MRFWAYFGHILGIYTSRFQMRGPTPFLHIFKKFQRFYARNRLNLMKIWSLLHFEDSDHFLCIYALPYYNTYNV